MQVDVYVNSKYIAEQFTLTLTVDALYMLVNVVLMPF
jgi:hypothetical protein